MIQRRGSVKQIARNLVNHGRVARCKVGWLVFGTVRHDFYPPAEGGINFRRVVAESFRLFARNSPVFLFLVSSHFETKRSSSLFSAGRSSPQNLSFRCVPPPSDSVTRLNSSIFLSFLFFFPPPPFSSPPDRTTASRRSLDVSSSLSNLLSLERTKRMDEDRSIDHRRVLPRPNFREAKMSRRFITGSNSFRSNRLSRVTIISSRIMINSLLRNVAVRTLTLNSFPATGDRSRFEYRE